jgi:hypothetical protein
MQLDGQFSKMLSLPLDAVNPSYGSYLNSTAAVSERLIRQNFHTKAQDYAGKSK